LTEGGAYALFSLLYNFFSRHRIVLYAVTLAIVGGSMAAFTRVDLQENIQSMLPDDHSDVAIQFRLLEHAPFARKVFVNLNGPPGTSSRDLIEAGDRLAKSMNPPIFSHVVSSPLLGSGMGTFSWLMKVLPNLVTPQDMLKIETRLTPEKIRTRLSEIYDQLLSPEGWWMKHLVQSDPLGLRSIVLEKLRFLNLVPGIRVEENHFLSADGRNVLLIADTPVAITDANGCRVLMKTFNELVRNLVPHQIEVSLISAHRYTLANAETMKRDLFVVLSISGAGILGLFFLFLRSWRALFLFLVPVSVLCIATVGVSLVFEEVSAVTIGFGSVLLGISVDFATHIYFALRSRGHKPAKVLTEVSQPVLFGGLTTMGAFSVLLFSSVPGQRQLAVFSITGMAASLILSLIVFPHLITPSARKDRLLEPQNYRRWPPSSSWILGIWGGVLALCLWQTATLRFQGDLRSLNLVPEEIRRAEMNFQEAWGNFRARALIFAEGSDLQTALKANDDLFAHFAPKAVSREVVSLAPIFPPAQRQSESRQRWAAFWSEKRRSWLRDQLEREGARQGFSQNAFAPFFEWLGDSPAPITLEALRQCGLGELVDTMIFEKGNKTQILTLVPDAPEMAGVMDQLDGRSKGLRFLSQRRFSELLSSTISRDFTGFIGKASLVILVFLSILFRDPKKIFYALVPVLTGLIFMFGLMGALGWEFNLFNIVATILVIGLGVDYGIFMVSKISQGYDHGTAQAVLVSGLTTLAGFGALVLAKHPALHSIGVTVLLGIGIAIPSALLVIPALYRGK